MSINGRTAGERAKNWWRDPPPEEDAYRTDRASERAKRIAPGDEIKVRLQTVFGIMKLC